MHAVFERVGIGLRFVEVGSRTVPGVQYRHPVLIDDPNSRRGLNGSGSWRGRDAESGVLRDFSRWRVDLRLIR
jgi:hypothetical protein